MKGISGFEPFDRINFNLRGRGLHGATMGAVFKEGLTLCCSKDLHITVDGLEGGAVARESCLSLSARFKEGAIWHWA